MQRPLLLPRVLNRCGHAVVFHVRIYAFNAHIRMKPQRKKRSVCGYADIRIYSDKPHMLILKSSQVCHPIRKMIWKTLFVQTVSVHLFEGMV